MEAIVVVNKIESTLLEKAKRVLDIEIEGIQTIISNLDHEFEKAIELIYQCKGRVVVSGMGKSGIVGRKISATLSSTGTPSFFMHPAEGSHGDSGAIMKGDVVLALSNSGETEEIISLIPLIKRKGLQLIAMTGKKDSTLAKKSDIVLNVHVQKEACPLGLAPTASSTGCLALGDALAVVLLDKRGFTSEDFLQFHPSGKLGKQLLWKVEDLMHKGDSLPIVNANVTFHESLFISTEKGLGLSIVTNDEGKAIGIITDGDIRRALYKTPDTSKLLAHEVMTKNPKIIDKEALAAEALQLMEKYSITSLMVVNNNHQPEGIIHIHDLLKAGVA